MTRELNQAVETMLASAKTTTLVLIGDFCLDVYFHVNSSDMEPSLETGFQVRRAHKLTTSLGGAGNVFANLCALGAGEIIPIGVIGPDMFGAEMSRLMKQLLPAGAPLTVQSEQWMTPAYIKPIVDSKEQERIDTGVRNRISAETARLLLDRVTEAVAKADVVLINQQLEDTIYTDEFIDGLNRLAAEHPEVPFIVDSRTMQRRFKGMWHKLNTHEVAAELGIELDPMRSYVPADELRELMRRYHEQTGDPLIVSRGDHGATAYDGTFTSAEGLSLLTELDTVGAGDSFFSGFALALAAGLPIGPALHIGNSVAGVTVQKLHQTGTCSPEELRAIVETRDLNYNVDEHPVRRSKPFTAEIITDLETIRRRPAIEYAVFDHDGTISTLREGWEEIMEACMIDAIMGSSADDEELKARVRAYCRDFIVRSTGIQTINQMVMLVEAVRKWGLVPESEIRTPQEYKRIYNDALLAFIEHRVERVRKRLLSPEEVTIAGSIALLRTLAANGVKIYLASGTDQEDVLREAQLLGYAECFTGGIFGSVGDMHNDPKRQVLRNILKQEQVDPEKLVIFGDGPVEMRVARSCGALGIGVQSHEVRRYGWNESKHKRLLRAGADLLIPDFTEYRQIASFLLKKEL